MMTSNLEPLLTLVIPCYNEAENIPSLLARCKEVFTGLSVEVILVNNGSTDDTETVLNKILPEHPCARSVHVTKNCGYGYGIISGIRSAQGRYVGWTHADMQTDPGDIVKALEFINNDKEANTFIKGRRYGRRVTDLFFTIAMSLFESLLLRTKLWDINAQPTIMPKVYFDSLKNVPYDFSIDLFCYYTAVNSGLTVARFPVYFGKRLAGEAHLKSTVARIKYSARTIKYSLMLANQIKLEKNG